MVDEAFAEWSLVDHSQVPSLAAGPFGVPIHDRLLSMLTPLYNRDSYQALPLLMQLARRGQLVPEAAAIAAIGRHEAGTLGLRLLTKTLQRGFEEGAARPVANRTGGGRRAVEGPDGSRPSSPTCCGCSPRSPTRSRPTQSSFRPP